MDASGTSAEARSDFPVQLGSAQHGADIDGLRPPRQPQPTALPAQCLDVTCLCRLMHDLGQMIDGDAVGDGDLVDRT